MANLTRRQALAVGSGLVVPMISAGDVGRAAAADIDDAQVFNHRFATVNGIVTGFPIGKPKSAVCRRS